MLKNNNLHDTSKLKHHRCLLSIHHTLDRSTITVHTYIHF